MISHWLPELRDLTVVDPIFEPGTAVMSADRESRQKPAVQPISASLAAATQSEAFVISLEAASGSPVFSLRATPRQVC
jgi:hypothetical protein